MCLLGVFHVLGLKGLRKDVHVYLASAISISKGHNILITCSLLFIDSNQITSTNRLSNFLSLMTEGKIGPRVRLSRSTRCRLVTALVVASLLLFPLWRYEALSFVPIPQISITTQTSQSLNLQSIPERRKNVVIASSFGYHFDVYLAVAWTLKRVMRESSLRLYTPWPYYFDFQKIVDGYGLYNGEYDSHENLMRDVRANGGDGGIDLIIFGTCEIECVF